MTPLTKEQAEALAKKIYEIAMRAEQTADLADDDADHESAVAHRTVAFEFKDVCAKIRAGTFIEVQHD